MNHSSAPSLLVDDHDVRCGAGAGEVVAEAERLDLGAFDAEFDEVLADAERASFRQGACVIFRQARRCVADDEIADGMIFFPCGGEFLERSEMGETFEKEEGGERREEG